MTLPQTISQLTLIKTFSTSEANQNYTVHTHIHGKTYVFQINVDHETTVESFIHKTLTLLKTEVPTLQILLDGSGFELYAARRSGRKISDLPSFEGQQKVHKTGQKCFFLLIEGKDGSSTSKTNTPSTKSIRTEMKPVEIHTKEKVVEKQKGCFCFS